MGVTLLFLEDDGGVDDESDVTFRAASTTTTFFVMEGALHSSLPTEDGLSHFTSSLMGVD
jgi:hypothetical protein